MAKPLRLILIADDDEDIRSSLRDLFNGAGYAVDTAEDGQQALDHLRTQKRPDLIVLDLRMPQKSGQEVLDALRHSTTLMAIPVVVLSAYLDFPPPGAVAWLKKPVAPSLLLGTVENYLGGVRR